ncbi:hypothetical protein H8356DRAFT_1320730 [Neocallimastix lanati (nom. inval.)]|nr:hypothetical protein H8356DRAFT_1320730 [Neocallimastix sp. JGI-2020a]
MVVKARHSLNCRPERVAQINSIKAVFLICNYQELEGHSKKKRIRKFSSANAEHSVRPSSIDNIHLCESILKCCDYTNIPIVVDGYTGIIVNYVLIIINSSSSINRNVDKELNNGIVNPAVQEINILRNEKRNFAKDKSLSLKAEQDLAIIKVESTESEAYQLKNQQLTEKVIMMEFVEKWDGKLPTVTSGGSALFDISSFINSNELKDDKKGK